jgi:propionyl-CoA carboxylase alpha chain
VIVSPVTPITKLLVANRGEIASRIMRTARQLDIATVAVYSDADVDAPFVSDADEAVRLEGDSPFATYLRSDLLVGAAIVTGSTAVHPGYGFLSERAEFATACLDAGLTFVGPPPDVIDAMGSKIAAKELMERAGIPVLPGLTIADDVDIFTDLAERAVLEVGFPLLVKAVYGGGGRGMRVVPDPSDLFEAVTGARSEAQAAFGDGAVFLEHYVSAPRHIEVQIFGDLHGRVVSLFERECSIQRRYQKVIEESPSPVVDEKLRSELGEAATAAGEAIGYVGAGTVEFVLDPEGNFYFLEMNTRLQVEHPVTELVTGLDLVRLQLLVAEGRPLPNEVVDATMRGHAIEARLYAEDVLAGFLPSSGVVHRFHVPDQPGIRVDAGIASGSVVSVHYDSMLAKVIAHGDDRDQARRRLAWALDHTQVHGVPTNRELLVGILRESNFAEGAIDTGYIGRQDLVELCHSRWHPTATGSHALAAALAAQAERRAASTVLSSLPSGWRNVINGPQEVKYDVDGNEVVLRYRFERDGLFADVNGEPLDGLEVLGASGDRVDLAIGGVRRTVAVHRDHATSFVTSSLGTTTLTEIPRFPKPDDLSVPGSLVAPMPGTVVRINVREGSPVTAGTAIVVLEAMKMEHTVAAPADGVVAEVCVHQGESVDVGTVLAVVDDSGQNGDDT